MRKATPPKRHTLLFLLLLLPVFNASSHADEGGELSSLSVVQATLMAVPHCFHYQVTGLCLWSKCIGGICTINTTLKVEHYLPDSVVSVFQSPKTNPWRYAHTEIDPPAYQLGQSQIKNSLGFAMGFGQEQAATNHDTDTHFKEVDVIGNPAIELFNALKTFVLPSTARPFVPYYVSMADSYLWRSPLIETLLYPHSLIPGTHSVGGFGNNWGSVYPRTGFLLQPIDAKAAAVMAQRAADIATRQAQSHVYQPLATDCGRECRAAEANENDPRTKWQMIYPKLENTCMVFGEKDLQRNLPWNSDAAQKGHGNYVWILWRHYKGCIPGEGQCIGSVDFRN
jgi:integrating conjugative element protein (TIGR03756 family)